MRTVVLAPSGKDGDAACQLLHSAGLEASSWSGATAVAGAEQPTCWLITVEALADRSVRHHLLPLLQQSRAAQRVLLIVGHRSSAAVCQRAREELGDQVGCRVLRRPLRRDELLIEVRAAQAEVAVEQHVREHPIEQQLAAHLGFGMLRVSPDLRQVRADATAARALGCSIAELQAHSLFEGPARSLAALAHEAVEAFQQQSGESVRGLGGSCDGRPAVAAVDAEGVVLLVLDEAAETGLLARRSGTGLAEQMARLRHDLQAPLRQINMWLELAECDGAAGEFADFLRSSREAATAMYRLIEGDLRLEEDASRQATGCDPAAVVAEVQRVVGPAIAAADGELSVDRLPERVPLSWHDCYRLLQNLITNALRYRSDAPPRIRLHGDNDADGVVICVCDNGIGMSPELAATLFRPYAVGPESAARGGTGLGLAICHDLVSGAGGTITIDSRKGVGSTFRVSLPCQD